MSSYLYSNSVFIPSFSLSLFFHACKEAILFSQPLCTLTISLGQMDVFLYNAFKVRRQHEQILNNIVLVLLKNQLLYSIYTHNRCIKCKFYSCLISSAFIMVTIAVAPKHFILFPLTIIYHLIIPKCFLQSEDFINNPFSLSLFFDTIESKSNKHLSSYVR